jgi:hypothetical protein
VPEVVGGSQLKNARGGRGWGPKSKTKRSQLGFGKHIEGEGLYFNGGDPLGVGESMSEVVGGCAIENVHEGRGWGPKLKTERSQLGFGKHIEGEGLYFNGGDPLGVGESMSEVVGGGARLKTRTREGDRAKVEN